MRKDKKFAETEYAQNPLYRRMKERFSVEGQVTIGDFMRNRARRDGYTVSGGETTAVPYATGAVTVSAPTAVVSAPVQSAPKKAERKNKTSFFRRHATFFACFALFLCIALTLSVIIPVWTSVSASAGNDGIDRMAGIHEEEISEVVPTPAPEVPQPSFDNVMSAFND